MVVQLLVGVHAFACDGALRVSVPTTSPGALARKGKTKGVPAFVPSGTGKGSIAIRTSL